MVLIPNQRNEPCGLAEGDVIPDVYFACDRVACVPAPTLGTSAIFTLAAVPIPLLTILARSFSIADFTFIGVAFRLTRPVLAFQTQSLIATTPVTAGQIRVAIANLALTIDTRIFTL
jgi:hypothetical protein